MQKIGGKRSRMMRIREPLTGFGFILPSFAGSLVFVVIPFGGAILRSFVSGITGKFTALTQYEQIFSNQSFVKALTNTGHFIAVCIPILIVLSLLLALVLMQPVVARSMLRAAFLLPMAIPVASIALLWQLIFSMNGLMNNVLAWLSLKPIDWMHTEWAFVCLVASYVWKNIGYTMVLFIAGLSGINPALYEAAAVDGAGQMRQFVSITLPSLIPTVFTVSVLSLLKSFKVFREAYLVAGNYPHQSIYLMQHTLNNWFISLEMERLSAAAVVVSLVILMLVALLNRAWGMSADEGV